jgi:putative PIN family toxin of toxin-antitoxin system
MIRLTLDTNVLVAGTRSRLGASFQLLQLWEAKQFMVTASAPLFLEYEAVLKRSEYLSANRLTEDDIDTLLREWAMWVEPVTLHYLWRPQLTDANDELVLETAVNGMSDAIVTFNESDFAKAAPKFDLQVWSPADALKRLRKNR